MALTDTTAYPWHSDAVYAAELDGQGLIVRANPALRTGVGDRLEGEPFEALLTPKQRPAFRAMLGEADGEWRGTIFGLLDRTGDHAEDRHLWIRRDGDGYAVIAEPAWNEHGQLVAQVLQLNDDLIATRRRVARRHRELHVAQERAAEAVHRVGQLEAILLAGLTPGDFDDSLRSLLTTAQQLLPGNRADLLLLDEHGRLEHRASAGPAAPGGEDAELPAVLARSLAAQPVLERIAATSESVVIGDLAADLPGGGVDPGSLIGAPLRVDEQVIGVLAVRAPGPGCFDERDLRLLELVGERVALSIGQVQLRERERRLAETLQRSMLPQRLPEVPGLAVAARYHAHTARVGGDFFDAIPLASGRLGLAIGDVTGKGLRAAATMGRVRSGLYAYALDCEDPADVMTRLSRLARADDALATAQYLVVDPASGVVEMASAGHLPPLLITGAEARYLEVPDAQSAALGLDDERRGSGSFVLETGSTLLLYTDGIVERTRDIDDGMRKLAAAAVRLADSGPEALCDRLLRELSPAERFGDDVAVLAVRRD